MPRRVIDKERASRRVLVVTNMYPDEEHPDFGTFVREQVQGLRGMGVAVDVLVVGGKRDKLSYVRGTLAFWRQLRAQSYDVIHAHYVFSGVVARLQFRRPLVVSFHGAAEMVGWVGLLCRVLAPFADEVTVTSHHHRRQLGRRDAHVVPCGVDLDLFVPMERGEARRELGWNAEEQVVLFAGIPRPEKRLDVISAAVDILREGGWSVRLEIASGQPHERMPLYMSGADVLALASDHEGSPVVVKEAMACNLPIVSVDVGDVRQVIAGTDGCIICERNAPDMARALGRALDWGKRTEGREAVASLGLQETLDRILRIYETVWRSS
jgi:glycosyltransferase involved in cell wall biosynthesis